MEIRVLFLFYDIVVVSQSAHRLFLKVPLLGLTYTIVIFPDHIHVLFDHSNYMTASRRSWFPIYAYINILN